jgi:thioredoxin reductase (NADPH)
VLLPDGRRLEAPSFRALAEAFGMQPVPKHALYDVAIVGGGPAGLAAAVYGASEGLDVLVLESNLPEGRRARAPESNII